MTQQAAENLANAVRAASGDNSEAMRALEVGRCRLTL